MTLIAIVAAEAFGIEPSAITVKIGDTAFPASGGSGGSTTAASVSPAVFDACQNALRDLSVASGLADPRGPNWGPATSRLRIYPMVARGRWKEPCRYLRYKELFTLELVAASDDDRDIPAVANTWCNLTLKDVGRDDCPVSMIACSRPGRICYRSYLEQRPNASGR